MQVWDRDSKLTQSLQVAGQVASLDCWEDYIAVGSDVIQLIKLNPTGDPSRTLYANRSDPIQVTVNSLRNSLHNIDWFKIFLITEDSGHKAFGCICWKRRAFSNLKSWR